MKIVHICVCGEYYEQYAYQDNLLPKYHRKAGHEVTIIAATYSRFDPASGKVIQDHTRCRYLADGTKVIRLEPVLPIAINSHTHIFRGFKKALTDERPDFIFCHGVESPNYLFLAKYKRLHPDVKIVYDSHTDFSNSCHTFITRLRAKLVVRGIIVKSLLWTSDKFYGTTTGRCDFLKDIYHVPAGKVDFLPMGADDEKLHTEDREKMRTEVRGKYGIAENDFLIVTGGKIDSWKKTDTLAEAIATLDDPHIKLLIFGSLTDSVKHKILALTSERIQYIGWVPSDDVYRYFYAADLVAFPGSHSVLWEQAVASKVPLAIREDGNFGHVDFNGNCLLLSDVSSNGLMKAMKAVATDRDTYLNLKENAESEGAEQFLYSKIAQKVLDDTKC